MNLLKTFLSSASLILCSLACGSGTSATHTTTDAGHDSAATLAVVGDDCADNAMCASGLCDNNGYCATPVKTADGGKCLVDTDCPTGDHCNVATGDCFSSAKDNSAPTSCTTTADCKSDETCVSHVCQG
jgi:hypothetical protein